MIRIKLFFGVFVLILKFDFFLFIFRGCVFFGICCVIFCFCLIEMWMVYMLLFFVMLVYFLRVGVVKM